MARQFSGPYPREALGVLEEIIEHGPLALQSDFARQAALWVAFCASLGFITTITPTGNAYMRAWRITNSGLIALNHKDHLWPSSTS